MKLLSRIRLGARLSGAFLLIVALLVATIAFAIARLSAQNTKMNHVVQVDVETLLALARLETQVQIVGVSLRDSVLSDKDEIIRASLASVPGVIGDMDTTLQLIESNGELPEDVEQIKIARGPFLASVRAMTESAGRGDIDTAREQFISEAFRTASRAYTAAIDHVVAAQRAEADEERAQGEQEFTTSRNEMALFALIAMGLSIVVGMAITRSVVARLGRLQAGVHEMAAGRYEARVAVDGGDEIGSLQNAFNKMAADLQEDMEREKRSAREIEHLAFYDKLTGLPNRSLFSRLLEHSIAEARRHKNQLAVMFIDLDRFKNINDSLGHDAGDALLKEVAVRAKAVLRDSDAICRIGGDEFVVLLADAESPEAAATVAQKILAALAMQHRIAGHEFRITASIGISTFPADGTDEAALMKHADIAMYHAKEVGRNTFAFYAESMDTNTVERLAFESSLRRALDEGQLELHYQPKVDCGSGRMTGVEALLRWQHPDLGLVPPLKFIPIAEETGLIVPIGRWVFETACRQQVEWCRQGLAPMSVAVNLSGRQFADEHLLSDVDAVLAATGIDPAMLEFEITESVLMRDVPKGVEVLGAIKQRGIRLSIDDFGTGYSSLSTLKLFPIDTLKVDRSFVRELPSNKDDRAIADAIIAMGNTLGLSVIAEGVETGAQVDFLRAHGCTQMQGFFFSRAVPAAQIEYLLAAQPTGVLEGTDLTPAERHSAADSAIMTLA